MKTIQKNNYRGFQWTVFLFLAFALSGLQSCKKDTVKKKDPIEEPPKGEEVITIKSIIDKGEGATLDKDTKIVGVVISSNNSEMDGGLVIQDNTGSIFVDIGKHDFEMDDVVSISVGEKGIRSYNHRLQIEGVKKSEIYKVSDNIALTAKSVSIKDIIDNVNDAERLVKLSNVEIILLDNWSETNTYRLRDATGWVELVLPKDFQENIEMNSASVYGYFRNVEDKPTFYIRSKEDVVEEGEGLAEMESWTETFEDSKKKSSYNRGYVEAASGSWLFDGTLVDNDPTAYDFRPMMPRLVGRNKNEIVPGPGFIQPDFELENLNRISVDYIGYPDFKNDHGPFILEVFISKDEGSNWISLGQVINASQEQIVRASFLLDESMRSEKLLVKFQNETEWINTTRGNRINIDRIVFELDQ